MRKFVRNFALLGLVATGALLANPSPARAAFTLTLQQGASVVSVTDNGAGDTNPLIGLIGFNTAVGNIDATGSVASSNSTDGVDPAQLGIVQLAANTDTGGTLIVTLQDTGFTAPSAGPASMTSQLSTTQLPLGTTITLTSFLNAMTGTPLTLLTTGGTTGTDVVNIGGTPYTLGNVTTFTLEGRAALLFTGNTTVTAAPEPATVAMAATALPILGLGWWRRRRRTQS